MFGSLLIFITMVFKLVYIYSQVFVYCGSEWTVLVIIFYDQFLKLLFYFLLMFQIVYDLGLRKLSYITLTVGFYLRRSGFCCRIAPGACFLCMLHVASISKLFLHLCFCDQLFGPYVKCSHLDIIFVIFNINHLRNITFIILERGCKS